MARDFRRKRGRSRGRSDTTDALFLIRYRAFVKQFTGRRVKAYLTGYAASWLSIVHAPIFLGAYRPILLAELVGDKNPCAIGVLTAFRIRPSRAGALVA